MTTYVELAPISNEAKAREALNYMGWNERDEQDEVIDELKDFNSNGHFAVFEHTRKSVPKNSIYGEFSVLYTIGDDLGNRWYETTVEGFKDSKGRIWANEEAVDNKCC